jgi:glutamate-1-semialdehyde aminotransferase
MAVKQCTEKEWYKRALEITPGGAQTFSRMYGHVGPEGYPVFAAAASGAWITLTNGLQYIDLAGANASIPLGANHPAVVNAVSKYLGVSGTLSLPTHLEVETSEAMVDAVPYAEQVRWVKTGSEAVSGAVACARKVTGRHRVVMFDGNYHGWHPWTRDNGSVEKVYEAANVAATEYYQDGNGIKISVLPSLADVAAVLVEPPRLRVFTDRDRDWLKVLRQECTKAGTMLVFDDVVWGFRFARGGLQQVSHVKPDLACFSKALGNGVPVACIAGTKAALEDTPVSSTFGGETMGLAAAQAVLNLHTVLPVCNGLRSIGVSLMEKMQEALSGSPISVEGTPVHFKFVGEDLDRFLGECLKKGLLVHRAANNVSLPMSTMVNRIAHSVGEAANVQEDA